MPFAKLWLFLPAALPWVGLARSEGDEACHLQTADPCQALKARLRPVVTPSQLPCKRFFFVHVPKTGGTSVYDWIETNGLSCLFANWTKGHFPIQAHFENGRPADGSCFVTFVRDPVERWASGFLSRQRKGCPAYCSSWSAGEEEVFNNFESPSSLAEAMTSSNETRQALALKAPDAVFHLRSGFAFSFDFLSKQDLRTRVLPHVLYTGATCALEESAPAMLRAMGLPEAVVSRLPEISWRHAAPSDDEAEETQLSELAVRNIRRYTSADSAVLRVFAKARLLPPNLRTFCAHVGNRKPT
mmetsp:Transcript_37789/g.87472  ORF Transcript_37789/g.87472 Transcript_37789/m.87472 type:complete len:300 (-) Transcript_37789:7-906(-)